MAREKYLGDKARTEREGSFILGRPDGRCLQYSVSAGYTRYSKTSQRRKFTVPGFTNIMYVIDSEKSNVGFEK